MIYRTRTQWGAEFDVSTVPTITLPRQRLFVHHTGGTWTNDPNDDMLTIERVDIHRFGKPSYKWAIHPSGVVLEGMTNHRSPDTYGYNDDLSMCFMGNFDTDTPTPEAMQAGRELFAWLNTYGYRAVGCRILGHRDVYPTACPGTYLYPRLSELYSQPLPPIEMEEGTDMMNTVVLNDGTVLVTCVGRDGGVYAIKQAPGQPWGSWESLGGEVRTPLPANPHA